MRLTKLAKEAFVRAVMQDVPKVDNCDSVQKMLDEAVRKTSLPEVLSLYERCPGILTSGRVSIHPDKDKLTSHEWEHIRPTIFDLPSHQALNDTLYSTDDLARKGVLNKEQIEAIVQLITEQRNDCHKREELKRSLISVVDGCNTLKQLKEALPEFEKYMPSEKEPPSKNLPALANVVADFVAAGWPKDKKEESK